MTMDPTTKEGREAISIKLQGQEAAAKMGHNKRPDAWQAAALSHIKKLEAELLAQQARHATVTVEACGHASMVGHLQDQMTRLREAAAAERDELRAEVKKLEAERAVFESTLRDAAEASRIVRAALEDVKRERDELRAQLAIAETRSESFEATVERQADILTAQEAVIDEVRAEVERLKRVVSYQHARIPTED